MATGGVLGNGTKVAYSDTSPTSWTRVAQLLDIPQFLSLVAADVDTTVHSTSRLMTSMPGMIPVPEVKLMALADLDELSTVSQEHLRTLQTSGATVYWRIEIPVNRDQTKFRAFEFSAYVKEWTPDATKIAEAQKLNVVLRYAGGLNVYPAGASTIT